MKLPSSIKNWISLSGAILALFNIASILSLFILSSLFNFGGSYIGLFIYIVLPIFMVTGLVLIPIGMRIYGRKIKREEKAGKVKNWPVINLNKKGTRNTLFYFIIGSVFLLIISSIGSYEAYHFTESVEFCGKLCHKVMEPEYVTYYGSSHERVACVECHVGSGANWYIKSKLSGLYQVYSVLAKKYPTPIPTPIANLRPARETCEQCHWPDKFYDQKIIVKHAFLADETNSERIVHLQIKTSTKITNGKIEKGIHQHISPDVRIEYKALDPARQIIPWVRYTNLKTGVAEVFTDSETTVSKEKLDSLETRVMDCLDCHNRPSHNYRSPQTFVDKSISKGEIDRTLPGIKIVSMAALYKDYPTLDSAFQSIKTKVTEYYKSGHPELFDGKKAEIDNAILKIQAGYADNIFPFMKASWKSYPNNIGHLETDGCFRCHNNRHSTGNGKVISKECTLCHNILAQGTPDNMEYSKSFEPIEFKHPVDIDQAWRTEPCSTCHSSLY